MDVNKNLLITICAIVCLCIVVSACTTLLMDKRINSYDEVSKDYDLTFDWDSSKGKYHCYITFDADKDGYLQTEYVAYTFQHMYHKGHNSILLSEGSEFGHQPDIVRFFE